jgi:hypothetical protein
LIVELSIASMFASCIKQSPIRVSGNNENKEQKMSRTKPIHTHTLKSDVLTDERYT